MALNLTRELAKYGYKRKNSKSFVVNKVKNCDSDIMKKNNILFEDPNTFLQLPYETNFKYIVNKIPRGPQYDIDDKLIPYTILGNAKYLKANKYGLLNSSKSASRKSSFITRVKETNFIRLNNINNYNIISDKEIRAIFNSYKNKIQENKTKYKDDLISNDECSKLMKQFIDKSLSLQEKCLKKNEDNLNLFKNMEEYILQKMKLKAKNKRFRKFKTDLQNNNVSKDINLTLGELVMNSGEENRLKNEFKTLIQNKNNKKFVLPNVNQNWEMSLRRPRNLIGTRKELLNYGTQNNPCWSITTEKNTQINEYVCKPRKDFNYTTYGAFPSRTNSIQNLFNIESNKNKTNDDSFKNYIKRNTTCETLEIQGQKLIDFEENLCRKLKGKKKLLNFKNNKEEVKDMTIHADYTYNNFRAKSTI